jgi:hypothetical protein
MSRVEIEQRASKIATGEFATAALRAHNKTEAEIPDLVDSPIAVHIRHHEVIVCDDLSSAELRL